jgi:hypothetical protein
VTQVVLRQHDGRWIVKVQELERIFADEMEAMNCAIQLAQDSGKNGSPSVVLLHADDATFREIWTYGKDAFPLASAS